MATGFYFPWLLPFLQQAYQRLPLLRFLDCFLLGPLFNIAKSMLEWPPTQAVVLAGTLYIAAIKHAITLGPHMLWVLFSIIFSNDTEASPTSDMRQITPGAIQNGSLQSRPAASTGPTPTGTKLPGNKSQAHPVEFGSDDAVRTPDESFSGLELVGYPFKPHYFEFQGLRLHYLDEPPSKTAAQSHGGAPETLLFLHGNPTWSFLFRHTIPHLTTAGFRVLAMDFAGFGKSDKLVEGPGFTAELHASSVIALLDHLNLDNVTIAMHDWAGIYMMWNLPDLPTGRIGRLVVLNTALPPHPLFRELGLQNALLVAIWMAAVSIAGRYIPVTGVMKEMVPSLPVPHAMGYGTPFPTPNHELAVVRAPRLAFMTFFSGRQVAALRSWGIVKFLEAAVPGLSDIMKNNERNMLHGNKARNWLRQNWNKPTLLLFGSPDPLFGSVQHLFPGNVFNSTALAYSPQPIILSGAGHYLTETEPEKVALEIIKFVLNT